MKNPLWLYAASFCALAACSVERRVVVVTDVDLETRLAVEACPAVAEALGNEGAARLLDGHVLRPGQRLAIVVREWDPEMELAGRRVTLFVDPGAGAFDLPDPRVAIRADRVSPDGRDVKDLTIEAGELRLERKSSRVWFVVLTLEFGNGEPPLAFERTLGRRVLDGTGPREGRANPIVGPREYTRP